VRDVVIGAAIAYSDGSLARARGRVVKNVAGYDLPRLLCGSMGTLGVLTEASFKLQPKPLRSASLVAGFASAHHAFAAARALTAQPWEPVFVEVFMGACTPQLAVGFDGRDDRVDGLLQQTLELLAEHRCTGQLVLEGQRDSELRTRLDDPVRSAAHGSLDDAHTASRSTKPGVVLRWWGSAADVQETAELLAVQQTHGLITRLDARPLLGQIFASIDHPDAATLQASTLTLLGTLRQSGSAVLLAAPDALRSHADTVWGQPPSDFVLMTQLKAALDPSGTFAPGRFVGGL
jgi:glycolate oxidase FAD binding subunit